MYLLSLLPPATMKVGRTLLQKIIVIHVTYLTYLASTTLPDVESSFRTYSCETDKVSDKSDKIH